MFKRRRNKSSRPKRPVAVTVIAAAIVVLLLVRLYRAVMPLAQQGILRGGITAPLVANGALTAEGWALVTSVFYFLFAMALVLVMIGFLRLRRWAWVALMVWTGLSLALAIAQYFYGQPNYLVMASDVIIALALSQAEVQKIYGIRTGNAQAL
jgi:hypothetical protein